MFKIDREYIENKVENGHYVFDYVSRIAITTSGYIELVNFDNCLFFILENGSKSRYNNYIPKSYFLVSSDVSLMTVEDKLKYVLPDDIRCVNVDVKKHYYSVCKHECYDVDGVKYNFDDFSVSVQLDILRYVLILPNIFID